MCVFVVKLDIGAQTAIFLTNQFAYYYEMDLLEVTGDYLDRKEYLDLTEDGW